MKKTRGQKSRATVPLSTFNPLMTNIKSCSDWAKIFSIASVIYFKNIIFYALIFYLALLKSY
jgi:hypothetical protein